MLGIVGHGETRRLCERYLKGEAASHEQVAQKIREKVGGEGSIQAHAEWAKYCFDNLEAGQWGINA